MMFIPGYLKNCKKQKLRHKGKSSDTSDWVFNKVRLDVRSSSYVSAHIRTIITRIVKFLSNTIAPLHGNGYVSSNPGRLAWGGRRGEGRARKLYIEPYKKNLCDVIICCSFSILKSFIKFHFTELVTVTYRLNKG